MTAGGGRRAVYRSAFLAVLMQWLVRLIGLVSVVALARLLDPRDFGVIAVAMTAVAFVELFGYIGLRQALLRVTVIERGHYDTAWTIQLLIFLAMTVVTAGILAPLAADFYDKPALTAVLWVLSLRFLFLGLINIGIVDFERDLEFGRDLKMRVSTRLVSLVITLVAAWILRNYWALVIGLVSQSLLFTIASYIAHPYRPRLSLVRRSELLGMSIWMFLVSSAMVVQQQVQRLVIGRFGTSHMVGLYAVSQDLAEIFTQEISTALNRVTFVTVARSGLPLDEQQERVGSVLGTYAMVAAPLAAGLAATSHSSIAVLLGEKWHDAAPLLQIVAIYSGLYAVYKPICSMLLAGGHGRLAAILTCAGAALSLGAAGVTAFFRPDMIAIAYAALAANAAILCASTFTLARVAKAKAFSFAADMLRPFAAAGVMALVLLSIPQPSASPFLDLLVRVPLGGAVYVLALFLIWFISGRPAGAESEAIAVLARLRRAKDRKSPDRQATELPG